MGVELLGRGQQDEPIEGGLGSEGEARNAPGSEVALDPRDPLALEDEFRRRLGPLTRGRKEERNRLSSGVGPRVGIGEGGEKAFFDRLERKLIGMVGRGRVPLRERLAPEEEAARSGKPVPVYDDHEGGSSLDAEATYPGEMANLLG
jgi:hypothetical protein